MGCFTNLIKIHFEKEMAVIDNFKHTVSALFFHISVYSNFLQRFINLVLANFMKCRHTAMVIGIRKNLLISHFVCPQKMKIWCNWHKLTNISDFCFDF